MPKTTNEDFELFKEECWNWIKYFGLIDWEWNFTHDAEIGNHAEYWVDVPNRACTISYTSEYSTEDSIFYTEESIKKAAFHEVCEILLARIASLISGIAESDIAEAKHDIIRILENTIYKDVSIK